MAELENKVVSKELVGKARLVPRVREKGGATTDDLPPEEIAALLALFELLGTWEKGKKGSHGNEN
jgi:hypothetical protein